MMIPNEDHIEPGLVVLGASQFSSPDHYGNPAFKRSKNAFIAAAIANGIPTDRVIDSFDSQTTVGVLVDKIDDFLRRHPVITDLIIYYCGHGGFTKMDEFYLAIRSMRKGRESSEGLSPRQLRADLNDRFSNRRVYLVLDCCFAGAALTRSQWMSGGDVTTVVANQVFESFPKTGTALLAAAPASASAKAFTDEEYTVFTNALVRVLHDGIDNQGPRLSLRDIFNRAEVIIKDERAGVAPMPELYPRAQDHSDVAATPIFLNAVRRTHSSTQTAEIERRVSGKQHHQRSIEYHNEATSSIAERIEEIAIRRGPLDLSLQAIAMAFLLSILSFFCGLGWLEINLNGSTTKEIGFLFAPNWTIVYLVLFPLYLSVFSVLAGRCRLALTDLSDARILVDSNGSPVLHATILAAWNRALKDISPVMWLIMMLVAVSTLGQWIYVSVVPLMTGKIGNAAIDWGTLTIVQPEKANWWATIFFSTACYAYMGVALFIYLAILIYAATFAVFLNRLADQSGRFNLVFRSSILSQRLSGIVTSVYICVIFGIGAAIAMRMQAEYIQSGYSLITDLWFSDVISAFHWIVGDVTTVQPPQLFQIPSKWTSFAELMITLFTLFIVVFLMHSAFDKARLYYLEHIRSVDWRRRMDIRFNREEIRTNAFPDFFEFGDFAL